LFVTLPETIVRRRCAALIPYARNARTHSDQQVAQIAASIREFGNLRFAGNFFKISISNLYKSRGAVCRLHYPRRLFGAGARR
jgi:hypothetical protein